MRIVVALQSQEGREVKCKTRGCVRPARGQGLCQICWRRERRSGRLQVIRVPTVQERLLLCSRDAKSVHPRLGTKCKEWTGRLGTDGYGDIRHKHRHLKAHRVAWEEAFGAIPTGMCVLHRCDNRTCINVEHLFLGTRKDNNMDTARKLRHPTKLGPSAAVDIRSRAMAGESARCLADEYGIDPGTVRSIAARRIWSHV